MEPSTGRRNPWSYRLEGVNEFLAGGTPRKQVAPSPEVFSFTQTARADGGRPSVARAAASVDDAPPAGRVCRRTGVVLSLGAAGGGQQPAQSPCCIAEDAPTLAALRAGRSSSMLPVVPGAGSSAPQAASGTGQTMCSTAAQKAGPDPAKVQQPVDIIDLTEVRAL